jgi:hypothetical protein
MEYQQLHGSRPLSMQPARPAASSSPVAPGTAFAAATRNLDGRSAAIGKRINAPGLLHRVPRRCGSAGLAEVRNIFEIGLKTRNWHGQWNPIGLDRTPRDRAGIECDASWDFGAPARQRLRNCLVRLCEMPSTTLPRLFHRFQPPAGDEGYRAALEKLEEEASRLRAERIYLSRSAPGLPRSPAGDALGGSV